MSEQTRRARREVVFYLIAGACLSTVVLAQLDPCWPAAVELWQETNAAGDIIQDCRSPEEDLVCFAQTLMDLRFGEQSCLLGEADVSEVGEGFRSAILDLATKDEISGPSPHVLSFLTGALIPASQELESTHCEQDGSSSADCKAASSLQDDLEELRVQVDGADPTGDGDDLTRQRMWEVRSADYVATHREVNIEALFGGCRDAGTCERVFGFAAKFLRIVMATESSVAAYRRPTIQAGKRFLDVRENQWVHYFNSTKPQYPWELAFNSWSFTRSRDRVSLAALPEPPRSQWILLHPEVAYEYSSRESELGEALLLSVAGIYRWKWRDCLDDASIQGDVSVEECSKPKRGFGASLILSFVDQNATDTTGFGILLHLPKNLSLGVVKLRPWSTDLANEDRDA